MDPVFVAGMREAKALLDEGILTQVSLCIPRVSRLAFSRQQTKGNKLV